ncbi:MAG: sensor domain-containing diguanylate cyclase [Candidatus Omnitrophica bacterium]|nr:sensor domain-containing diguanylate cyclase [Candidatus Omnitrophota bacterium]
MTDQPRVAPAAKWVALLLLAASLHFLSSRILDLFFFLIPLAAAVLVLASTASGPVGNAVALLLLGVGMIHPALTLGRWDLLVLWWGALAGAGLLIVWGQARLKTLELASQDRYEETLETVNALEESVGHLELSGKLLRKRLQRYAALRVVMDALGAQASSLDGLLTSVARQSLSVLDHADVSMVYLVEIPHHDLALRAVFWKSEPPGTIKRKTGDLYDQWAFRQGQPLLVRDVTKDFRFPREAAEGERLTGAILIVPLISAQRVLGLLRVESSAPDAFTPEDLRLLDIVADVSAMAVENVRLYQRTAELAVTDDLTGLAVHRYFHERLEEELARARLRNQPASVLLIDLDRFKCYNDTYGHPAGDKLLRTMAQTLRQCHSSGELLARYGGEEFAVLLSGVDMAEAIRHAELIRATIEAKEIVLRQGKAKLTVSIGVATFPQDGIHRERLLETADRRLYQAKERGRNQVCFG